MVAAGEHSSNDWRAALPVLTGRTFTLREPRPSDLSPFIDLLATRDAPCCGSARPLAELDIQRLIDRVPRERADVIAFCYRVPSHPWVH